jgi:hypothetical protein
VRKRNLLSLAVLLMLAVPASAQHHASLTWQNSPDTNNTLVYRIAGTCPSPVTGGTKLTASPVTTAAYTDSTVNAGTTYAYYATAFLNGNESVPSNCVSATIPIAPPTGLTISNVAILRQGTQDRLQVDWTDTNGASTSVNIFGGQGQPLKQVTQTTTNGVYSYAILIPVQNGSISICDAHGCVTQTFQGI